MRSEDVDLDFAKIVGKNVAITIRLPDGRSATSTASWPTSYQAGLTWHHSQPPPSLERAFKSIGLLAPRYTLQGGRRPLYRTAARSRGQYYR